jgi:hypothetical protein
MNEDILSAVVKVEKEIARAVELEKTRSQERLDRLKRDCDSEVLMEKKCLQDALNRRIDDIRTCSEKTASEIISGARAGAERFKKISDDALKEIIMKHIGMILP